MFVVLAVLAVVDLEAFPISALSQPTGDSKRNTFLCAIIKGPCGGQIVSRQRSCDAIARFTEKPRRRQFSLFRNKTIKYESHFAEV